ncbi:MAG: hypothetical protein AAGJ40_16785 [Planctomycetota bacterium]
MSDNPYPATSSTPPDPSLVHQSPRSIAPAPRLSTRGLVIALATVCLIPLASLSLYAVLYGKASEQTLPVSVLIDRRPLPTIDGRSQMLEDVLVVENLESYDIPNVTLNLNGQYFLYQDRPLPAGETLVVRQAAFATKSNQFWKPGRYPITKILVTGRLPSGARGVTEVLY